MKMGNYKNGVIVALLGLSALFDLCSSGEVTCSVEEYIITGLEFSDCQKEALKSFKPNDPKPSEHSCKILKDVVEVCATLVQVCIGKCPINCFLDGIQVLCNISKLF